MAFNALSGLLKSSARKRGIASQVEAAMILEFFKQVARDIFGDEALKLMRPLYVKEGVLTIAVLSPAFAQELKLRESDVTRAINEKMAFVVVKHLRLLS